MPWSTTIAGHSMAKQFSSIESKLRQFIEEQKVFFVATAAGDGRVNLSPKGMDTLKVVDANRVDWLSVTGSGNETAAHILDNPRMTLMFTAFTGNPLILRLYGTARAVYPSDAEWAEIARPFEILPGTRQIFSMQVEMAQTSCGMSIPQYDYQGDREHLNAWAESKGVEGMNAYRRDKNVVSIDGKPTGLPVEI